MSLIACSFVYVHHDGMESVVRPVWFVWKHLCNFTTISSFNLPCCITVWVVWV